MPDTDIIYLGDCIEVMQHLIPPGSVDMIFADPPYNLTLRQKLFRPEGGEYQGVTEKWDKFESFGDYCKFTSLWLAAAKQVLKPTGTIWVSGTYHNIYIVGYTMMQLGYFILNDILWIKPNPTPNFAGVRFTAAHENLIWAQPRPKAKYTFNYHDMKAINGGKQMRSDWLIPICNGKERMKDKDGQKLHSAQKPERLLERIIMATTHPGDLVLDPFFGTGTTGLMASRLGRHWIGIDIDEKYVDAAAERISNA